MTQVLIGVSEWMFDSVRTLPSLQTKLLILTVLKTKTKKKLLILANKTGAHKNSGEKEKRF